MMQAERGAPSDRPRPPQPPLRCRVGTSTRVPPARGGCWSYHVRLFTRLALGAVVAHAGGLVVVFVLAAVGVFSAGGVHQGNLHHRHQSITATASIQHTSSPPLAQLFQWVWPCATRHPQSSHSGAEEVPLHGMEAVTGFSNLVLLIVSQSTDLCACCHSCSSNIEGRGSWPVISPSLWCGKCPSLLPPRSQL